MHECYTDHTVIIDRNNIKYILFIHIMIRTSINTFSYGAVLHELYL